MSNPLCQGCQGLDFQQLVNNTEIPMTGVEIVEVGKRSMRRRKKYCNLCHFFRQLGPDYAKNYTLHVRLFTCIMQGYLSIGGPLGNTNAEARSDVPLQPFFCVIRKNARLTYDSNVESEIKAAGIACYTPREGITAFQLCAVDSMSVNWEAIKRQLEFCSQHHPSCRQEKAHLSRLPYISLIDCANGSIVKGSLSNQFLALSYVWGTKNETTNSMDHFSLQNAPFTIRDAAKAVLELGRRYLWVDRYCINQEDGAEKKTMIDNMDLIYESADATLVALHGDNDQSGLPGVSTLSRNKQPTVDTDTGQLIYSFPTIESLIEGSQWNTRGWTYQEARLSRRCLFFSRYQVYLVCRDSTWSEAVPFDPVTNWVTKLLNSQKLESTLFGIDIHRGWLRDRLEYSKRNLSHETDALDAFRGVLRRSSFITLWGVPVMPEASNIDPNVGFSLGLLWTKRPTWQGKNHVRSRQRYSSGRRANFPTWSWTSLHADISQDVYGTTSKYGQYLIGATVCFPENRANIQFSCVINGYIFPLPDAIAITNSPILPEHSRELYVEGDIDFATSPSERTTFSVNGCTMSTI